MQTLFRNWCGVTALVPLESRERDIFVKFDKIWLFIVFRGVAQRIVLSTPFPAAEDTLGNQGSWFH
jgi:hypothetical protein